MRRGPPSRNPGRVVIPSTLLTDLRNLLSTSRDRKSNYLRQECLSKYVSPDTEPPEVRRQRAINKWLAVEIENGATNDRLLTVSEDYQILPHVTWRSFRDFVSNYIGSIIGELPPSSLFGEYSGGATTSRRRTSSHPALKFVGKADVTDRAVSLACEILVDSQAWVHHGNVDLNVVAGNVLFTVPKNAEIDRCAAKEPDLNMFLQKGVGNFFRSRLRRFGIDLNDQSRNRDLARIGSLDGSLATLDLSSASDSISTQLVAEFLPPHWYRYLSDIRSPVTIIDGIKHVNEMFSSMGNGFTFELESLLFYSISRAVAYFEGISGIISVYGDDIIVPTDVADPLIAVLTFLGFQCNLDKTHVNGSFRESCGGHYDGGYDVTPFYLKAPPKDLFDLILLGNKILKWSLEWYSPSGVVCDPFLLPFWYQIQDLIPPQLWGGQDLDSDSALVTGDVPRKRLLRYYHRASNGIGGYLLGLFSPGETSVRCLTSCEVRIVRNRDTVNRDILGLAAYTSRTA